MKQLRLRVEQNGQPDRYGKELTAIAELYNTSSMIRWHLDGSPLPENPGRVVPVMVEDNDDEQAEP